MNNPDDEIIQDAVDQAIKHGREHGISPGSVVNHPDEDRTFMLEKIEGDTAICVIPAEFSPSGEEIRKEFPAGEIFDANLAGSIALSILRQMMGPAIIAV